ncbi:MAG: hypothetical protein AAGF84_11365 [Planctomycetota bacterium]
MEWVDKIHSALSIVNVDTAIQTVYSQFDQSTINIIRICESHFIRFQFEPEANLQRLAEIREKAQVLFDAIGGADDIEDNAKQFMLRQLYIIIRSLDDYSLAGKSALERGVEATAGMFVVKPKSANAAALTRFKGEWKTILASFVLISTSYEGVKEIVEDVKDIVQNVLQITDETIES